MKEQLRAVYLVMENGNQYVLWTEGFWKGEVAADDPLYELLVPDDLRGEVAAWGGVHWTILDALSTRDPEAFDNAVRAICRMMQQPTVHVDDLAIWGPALVVKCKCPAFGLLRTALNAATSHLISRAPLTDEEFERSTWWVRHICPEDSRKVDRLQELIRFYNEAGAPPIPTIRHFRLSHLMGAYKALAEKMQNSTASQDDIRKARSGLEHVLRFGEPSHYGKTLSLHTSIVSGLPVEDKALSAQRLERYRQTILPDVVRRLGTTFRPAGLAIMGEDPDNPVTVRFFDRLTGTFQQETRPGVRVLETIPFAGSD